MSPLDVKIVKNEPVDEAKLVNLKITIDGRGERIFVQFDAMLNHPENAVKPRKLTIQKNYQNTFAGCDQANAFATSIKSLADMKAHLKIKE